MGRPTGTTNKKKKQQKDDEKEAKESIMCNYMWEVDNTSSTSSLFKKDIFANVVEKARQQFQLEEPFSFPYTTALSRIRRDSIYAEGRDTPMIDVEKEI